MNLNLLPDDCLLEVLDYFSNLKELLRLGQVCSRWRYLVLTRLRKIQQLDVLWTLRVLERTYKANHLYTEEVKFIERINIALVFPNLKIVRVGSDSRVCPPRCACKALANIITSGNPIIGLSIGWVCDADCDVRNDSIPELCDVNLEDDIVKHLGNLQFLLTDDNKLTEIYFGKYEFGQSLKRFGTICQYTIWSDYAELMPNLISLQLENFKCRDDTDYEGPKLMEVKELAIRDVDFNVMSYEFLDFFPNLQILTLDVIMHYDNIDLNESTLNYTVQKLILILSRAEYPCKTYSKCKRILSRFPNCEYLLIDFPSKLTGAAVAKIFKILPNLVMLAIREAKWAEEAIVYIVDKYCKSLNRRISFYGKGLKELIFNGNLIKLDEIDEYFIAKNFKQVNYHNQYRPMPLF